MGEPYERVRKPAPSHTHRDGSAFEPEPRRPAYEDLSPEARDAASARMLNADRADAVVERTPHDDDEVAAPEAAAAPPAVEEKRTEVGSERATAEMATVSSADDAFATELDGLLTELVSAATGFAAAAAACSFGGEARIALARYESVSAAADLIGIAVARKPPVVERSSPRGAFYRALSQRLRAGVAKAVPKIRGGARSLGAAVNISPQLMGEPVQRIRAQSAVTECDVIVRLLTVRRVEVSHWTPRA